MKKLIFVLIAAIGMNAHADAAADLATKIAADKDAYIRGYADTVYQRYTDAVTGAKNLDLQVQAFVVNPTDEGLQNLKKEWIAARPAYELTEVYRFYDGPIDGSNGPEGDINGWPLDEAYIDYVVGQPNVGIVNDAKDYPSLTPDVLLGLNALDGEKNLSTGWHAIEFLLWGQDLSSTGPGNRPYTDYVDGQGKNADRRREYLSSVSALLVQQLESVQVQWVNGDKNDYQASFVNDPTKFESILTGVIQLAGDELSGERMQVAYDSKLQEDEHSCFSDTTSYDLYNGYEGIRLVLTEQYNGVSFLDILRLKDAALADTIQARVDDLEAKFTAFKDLPIVFDQVIQNDTDRVLMKSIIDELKGYKDETDPTKDITGLSEYVTQASDELK